jgi:hypothetical protein
MFNKHQLMHINFFHNSLFLKFPYTYFGGLNQLLLHFIVTYFTILYEVDSIRPLIFYIYEYNHICNNCKVYAK